MSIALPLHIVQKAAAVAMGVFTGAFGFLFHANTPVVVLPESAVVYNAVAPLPTDFADATLSTPQATTTAVLALPPIPQGLLPKVYVLKFKIAANAKPMVTTIATAPASTSATVPLKTSGAPQVTPASSVVLPSAITAQWILDHATLSFKERFDGTYALVLTATLGGKNNISWGLDQTTVGGTGQIPQFSLSFDCNPPPDMPTFDDRDQSPAFKVRTMYSCDISLTALSGNDRSVKTKHFDFQTSAGSLVVRQASSVDTVLKNDKNAGSFVFDNRDSQPITITNLTLDASFVTLSTAETPLVVRFLDPVTDAILYDYHIENIPKDPTKQFSASQNGVTIPLSFTVPGNTAKALPINVVGVRRMSVSGIDPSVTVAVRGVGMKQADIKTLFQAASITWTCITPTGVYDPNALTGAYATGQACRE